MRSNHPPHGRFLSSRHEDGKIELHSFHCPGYAYVFLTFLFFYRPFPFTLVPIGRQPLKLSIGMQVSQASQSYFSAMHSITWSGML